MTPQHLESCFDALDENGLLRHTHLLTGTLRLTSSCDHSLTPTCMQATPPEQRRSK